MPRRVYLGGALTAGEPGGRAWWVPHELLEHLQAAYCSTLAVELDHLTSLCGPLACPEGAGMCEGEAPAVGLRTSVLMSLLPQDDQARAGGLSVFTCLLRDEQEWLARAMEARAQRSLPAEQQLGILRALLRTDMFERFLAERFPHSKARAPAERSAA